MTLQTNQVLLNDGKVVQAVVTLDADGNINGGGGGGAGAATSALQEAGNASLGSIDTQQTEATNTLNLIANAVSTAGLQIAQLSELQTIRDSVVDVATSTLQTDGNASLASIDLKTTDVLEYLLTIDNTVTEISNTVATAALQTDCNASLVSMDGKLPALLNDRVVVDTLGLPNVARQVATTVTSANQALTVGVTRISLYARISPLRYVVGTTSQTAVATTSHYLAEGERVDISVPATTPNIAVIRASDATVNGAAEITELV